MRVTILGCGRWGTFLAWYSAFLGHNTVIWGKAESSTTQALVATRQNAYLELPDSIIINSDLDIAVNHADIILIAIGAQGLRALCQQIADIGAHDKIFVLCMKGLEATTGKRLTQIFRDQVRDNTNSIAIWVGPGHVQDFIRYKPNCMVIDSNDPIITAYVSDVFNSKLIRFYHGTDLIGNEIGAAAKNVVGIAAGMLDGLELSSLKGALMARGAYEISRLITTLGGNAITAYGLSHLGDYEATLFSPHSHNRRYGEALVRGSQIDVLAEGVLTTTALLKISHELEVDLPVCNAVYSVINESISPKQALDDLFLRPQKLEFYPPRDN